MVTLLAAHADDRRVSTSVNGGGGGGVGRTNNNSNDDGDDDELAAASAGAIATPPPPHAFTTTLTGGSTSSSSSTTNNATTPTTANHTSTSSPSPTPSSSASSSCDTTTCIHNVDAAAATATTAAPTSTASSTNTTTATAISEADAALHSRSSTTAAVQRHHHHHQRHHSTTGVIRPADQAAAPSAVAIAALTRTRSDDDCDYADVVLRVKTADNNGTSSAISATLDDGSARSLDVGVGDAAGSNNGRPDIDQIRAFLESEYVPGADGRWTSTTPSALHQRDSFIHRSYNKKLLARKNAIDEIPKQQRPASMPVRSGGGSKTTQGDASAVTTTATSAPSNARTEPLPIPAQPAAIKRDSFLRNSLNSIRRSFSIRSSSSKKSKAAEAAMSGETQPTDTRRKDGRRKRWTTKSASGTDEPAASLLADGGSAGGGSGNNNSYLHGDGYALSDGGADVRYLNVPLENVRSYGHSRNSSTSSCTSQRSSTGGSRPASMAPLQSSHPHHQTTTCSDSSAATTATQQQQQQQSGGNVRTSVRSPSHQQQSSVKIDSKSLKHLQTSPGAGSASSTPSPVARSPSPHPAKAGKDKDAPAADKKEKKRKELSSGRQKKFHRHFQQVAADEHVINYYSCALVSDILLQGHLYITDHYFAFYSNVFGFVTKLLIPTVSVVRISKEKTAKIIPNAVGVATADERHVFGSFMSRESAYRLMLSVWLPVAPGAAVLDGGNAAAVTALATATSAKDVAVATVPLSATVGSQNVSGEQLEVSEEFSLEDDSSSAISGNESPAILGVVPPPPSPFDSTTAPTTPPSATTDASSVAGGLRQRSLLGIDSPDGRTSAAGSVPPQRSRSPAPQMVSLQRFYEIELPPRLMYVGYAVTAVLVLLSLYLMWRIWTVSAGQMQPVQPLDVNWRDVDENVDVYAEVLKWQRQMQSKGGDEAQIILNSNLEQIARVRKSLETLSILIHDTGALNLPADEETGSVHVADSLANVADATASL